MDFISTGEFVAIIILSLINSVVEVRAREFIVVASSDLMEASPIVAVSIKASIAVTLCLP